jgi:hypothetical protein
MTSVVQRCQARERRCCDPQRPVELERRLMIGDRVVVLASRAHQRRMQAEQAASVVDLIPAAELAGLDRQAASPRRPAEPASSGCSPHPELGGGEQAGS